MLFQILEPLRLIGIDGLFAGPELEFGEPLQARSLVTGGLRCYRGVFSIWRDRNSESDEESAQRTLRLLRERKWCLSGMCWDGLVLELERCFSVPNVYFRTDLSHDIPLLIR